MNHLDRYGEPIEPDQPPLHDPRCDGKGWIDADAEEPKPCLDCKPWLSEAARRRRLLDADQLRANPSDSTTRPHQTQENR